MIKTKKIEMLDGLELKEATFKNKQFPTHFHDTYSIGIIQNGIESIKIRDNHYIAAPKTIIIINENELHSNSFYDYGSYQTINLNRHVLTYFSKEMNHEKKSHFVFQNLITNDYLYELISGFHKGDHSNAYKQIGAIAKYLFQNYLVEPYDNKSNYANWKNIILEIKEFMNDNLCEKISIENIAKKFQKTPFQVIRAFKAHTGLTPIEYLTLIRLNKSKILLASGNALVDTALDCGFYDQSHFSNVFKKYFGISPKQYCDSYSIMQIG